MCLLASAAVFLDTLGVSTQPTWTAQAARLLYAHELIPARVRWWLAARGMLDWFRMLERGLQSHLGTSTRSVLARAAGRLFETRYGVLCTLHPRLAGDNSPARLMAALYRMKPGDRRSWIFGDVWSASYVELARGQLLIRKLSAHERWAEVTVHLGELLIVLTNQLPEHLPHARKIVGDICFESGKHFAERTRRVFGMPSTSANAPKDAIEILRMSEYIFRVNPEHWDQADPQTNSGFLEGTACPWFSRPGWDRVHCGIFGQFQAGISAAFGLRYQLSQTIPKHGGHTCRIDLKPLITLRTSALRTSKGVSV